MLFYAFQRKQIIPLHVKKYNTFEQICLNFFIKIGTFGNIISFCLVCKGQNPPFCAHKAPKMQVFAAQQDFIKILPLANTFLCMTYILDTFVQGLYTFFRILNPKSKK